MKYYVISDHNRDEFVGIIFHDYKNNNITCKTKYDSFIRCFNNLFQLSFNRMIFSNGAVRIKNGINDINIILNKICIHPWYVSESGDTSMLDNGIASLYERYFDK